MATIQERLRRLRTGETPGTAASPSGGPENETGERRAAQSGGLTVTERLAKMRQDGEEISRQREAKEQQIQQARVDLLDQALERQRWKEIGESGFPVAEGIDFSARKKVFAQAVEREREEQNSWGNMLGRALASGDSTLPTSNATTVIQDIRSSPAQVRYEKLLEEEMEREKQRKQEATSQWAQENPVAASAASVGGSLLSLADVLQQLVEMNAVGETLPRENLTPGEYSETLRGGVMEDMSGVGQFLYGTAMSGIDSVLASALGGGVPGVGGGILAAGAASSAVNDIKERGGTDSQALIGGIASGVFESLFESVSIGQLDALKELPVDSAKTLLKNITKSVVTNASEEGATEIANVLFDRLYMRELSRYSQEIQSRMAQGASEEEARSAALRSVLSQIGESALGGALMGAGFGAAGSAVGAYRNRSTVRKAQEGVQAAQGDGVPVTQGTVQEAAGEQQNAASPGEAANGNAGAASDGRASPSGTFDTVAAPAFNSSIQQGAEGVNRDAPETVKTGLPARGGDTGGSGASPNISVAQEGGTVNAADGSVGFVNRSRRELTVGQTRELERLARAAGTRIAMVDREGTFQQGWYQDGQVLVSAEAEDPYREVVKHELTHLMQETAPAEYQAYRNFVREIYQERGTLEENLRRLRELYLVNQVELTEERAMDELAADFAGELTEDERTIRRLAGERPSLARRFLDTLRDLIGRLRSALGRWTGAGEADREVAALEQAARLWENALAETGRMRAVEEQNSSGTAVQDAFSREIERQWMGESPDSGGVPVQDAFSREIERQWMGEDLDSGGAVGYDGGTEYIGQNGGVANGTGEADRTGDTGDRPAGGEGEGRNAYAGGDRALRRTSEQILGGESDPLRAGRQGLDPSLGQEPNQAWAAEAVVSPAEGTVAREAQSMAADSGVPSFVVRDDVWEAQGESAPAFTEGGQIYIRETIPEQSRGMIAPHEITHVMRYEGFQPYLDFLEKMPELLKMDSRDAQALIQRAAEHRGVDPFTMSAEEAIRVYDELNATVYGHLASGKISGSIEHRLRNAFRDLDSYAAELAEIHRQFRERRRSGGETRYSVKGTREAQREIERLRRQNERLRQEMRRTGIPKANRQAVERQARAVLEQYGSQYDGDRLANRLDALYEDMAARGGTPWQQQNAPTWEEIREQSREIARDVLAESRAEEGSDYYRGYDDALRELRSRAVSLDEAHRGALDSYGGYQSFLQRSYGRLRLQDSGTPVDVVYDELSQRWPELFPEDIGGPANQLLRMEEVAESLETVENNPFAGNMDRAVEYAAGDILERFYETPQEKPTFADRQERRAQERLREQRQRDREAKKSALDREKARHQETVRKVREHYQEANKRLREEHREANRKLRDRQAVTQLRDAIGRHAATLSRKLLRPTDTQHIPEQLRGSVLALLETLDLESGFAYEFTRGGIFQKVKPYSDPHLWQTKRTQAAIALKEAYQKLRESGELNTVVDPDLADNLEAVAQMGDVRLADMDREQLETVWRAIRAVEHSIRKADKMLADSRFQTISEAAKALLEDNGGKARTQLRGAAGGLDGLFNLDMLTPETFLHKLGRAGDDLYRQMRQAQDKQIQILDEAVETTRKSLADSGLKPYQMEREKRTFTLESGEKVTLTTAQIMELYNLTKRQQAQKHLYTGGIRPEAVTRGLRMEMRGEAAFVTEADVTAMVETLTPEQKALADKMRAYLSSDLSAHGNEATMAAYGYEKFKERDYWPIKVDRNSTRDDPAAEARSKTIPGYGMTKAVNPQASNPVTLHSVFDTYTQHVTEMATYAAWLGVSEDVTRLQNYRYNKGTTPTAKDMIQRTHGEGGNAYLQKLLGDIAQGTKARRDTVFSAGGLTSAFKASSVGANLRVILQQPTSILRAAEMIDMKYLAAGMARRGGWKKALEHAPIAKWKDWGYFEMDTGRSLKELMLGQDSRLEKTKSAVMAPAGWADSVAWGALWNAVELETQAKRPDLERDSPEFYEAANRRFGEIVDRTQVVDTVLHRSQIMRSENAANKMATSFMSEPTKIYNEVVRGIYDMTGARTGEERARAGRRLARTAFALTLSFAVNAVAQSLADAWRDDDRDKGFLEKLEENWQENFWNNFNPIGYVPYLRDAQSIAQGYEVSRMDTEVLADLVSAASQLARARDGEGKKTEAYAGLEMGLQILRAFGLPLANVKRDLLGLVNTALTELGAYETAYELDKLMWNQDNDVGRFVADLYRAMEGNWEDYEAIYQDMVDSGVDPERIASGMEDRMKEELGVKSVASLPVRYSPPGEDEAFDSFIQEAADSEDGWTAVLPEGSAEAARTADVLGVSLEDYLELTGEGMELEAIQDTLQALDALEPEDDMDRVSKLQQYTAIADLPMAEADKESALALVMSDSAYEKYQSARSAGVSTEDYVWFLSATDGLEADKDENGKSISGSRKAKVLRVIDRMDLNRSQKDALFLAAGYSESTLGDAPWR